nr:integrase, catalytic region, zinc finger, CCHC-type, peptidase aspartic, catalytic [Tanacetum cinerariifolium]
MKKELFTHQETISIMSQQKEAQIKFYKTRKDKEIDKVIALENKVKVLDNIVYKIGQSVQTMNMLNRNYKTSLVKSEFLKKAQRANLRLYDIGCYNNNLALMLAPQSDEVIRLEKESRSKLSDLIRPFDYEKLNNLYDLFVPQREKSSAQRYFLESWNEVTPPSSNPTLIRFSNKQQIWMNMALSFIELIEIILFIVDSGCSKYMTGNLKHLANFVKKFLGRVKFRNDQIAPILGHGDLVQGTVTIKRVYYVEGLNHNLFSVGQLCDADLKVALRKSTCYIRDLKGNDLLKAGTVTTSNELDLLFSLMFGELLNGSSQVVSKSSAVTAADAPNQFEDDEFINIFCTPVQDRGETSSRHVDSSNMRTFYQCHPSEHRWTKDHPLEQVIGNPSQSVRTRRQLESDGEMCMFALSMNRTELKNIKEAMADSAWIESM